MIIGNKIGVDRVRLGALLNLSDAIGFDYEGEETAMSFDYEDKDTVISMDFNEA